MLQRNKDFEAKLQQGFQSLFTVGVMVGSMGKLKIVGDLSQVGLRVVTTDWHKVEFNIDLAYEVANIVQKYLPKTPVKNDLVIS